MRPTKAAKPAAKGPTRPGASATTRPSRIPPRYEADVKYHADQAAMHLAMANAFARLARRAGSK